MGRRAETTFTYEWRELLLYDCAVLLIQVSTIIIIPVVIVAAESGGTPVR